MSQDPVIIGIATIDGRQRALKDTLESLAPQADAICVYHNGYEPRQIYPGNVVSFFGDCHRGDMGDTGKFFPFSSHWPTQPSGYCLTCDDDLIYPPDYVERMIEGIERYERKAVCSFHGKAFTQHAYPWYNSPGERFPCLREVISDRRITIPGTGVMGWHSSLLTVSLDDLPYDGICMADILFAKLCNERKIPRYVLAHDEGWIRHTNKIDMDSTVWRVNKKDEAKTSYISDVFNSVEWAL